MGLRGAWRGVGKRGGAVEGRGSGWSLCRRLHIHKASFNSTSSPRTINTLTPSSSPMIIRGCNIQRPVRDTFSRKMLCLAYVFGHSSLMWKVLF